ncbi:MAG: ABC transporter permease [Hyphomonas sp.]
MDGTGHEIEQVTAKLRRQDVFEYSASKGHIGYALDDLFAGLARYRLVNTMVRTDFKARYKGTLLGAFWLTATAGVTVLGLGLVYSQVFGVDLHAYLPYVALGMMVWGLINGFVTESVTTFSGTAGVFTQIKIPMSVFPMTLTGRLMTTFFYRALVVIAILIIGGEPVAPWQVWYAFGGLAIIAWVGFWTAMLFGILGARFRDFGQLVNAFMTFSFFMTPVFWQASRLGRYAFVAHYNPFYHFLNIVRGPLVNGGDLRLSFMVTGIFAAVLPVVAFGLFARFRHRLAYWC